MPDLGCVGSLFAKLELRDHTVEGRQKARSGFSALGDVMFPVGTALAGLGGALMLCEERFKDLNLIIEKTSINSQISASDMRDLAMSFANADFPLQQVITGMEALNRSGVKTEERMAPP